VEVSDITAVKQNFSCFSEMHIWIRWPVGLSNTFKHLLQRFLLPTDAQENCFQRSIKIDIKIKIAPTCFGVITTIRERAM